MSQSAFFASSPDRFSFLIKSERARPNPTQGLLDFYERCREDSSKPSTVKIDMERDLRSSREISQKCKSSETYSQNLYAALCNNSFYKDGQEWMCSWRHSGGIVADLREQGDYIDWYCSGIKEEGGFVEEGHIAEEIRTDLASIGWSCH